MSSKSLLKASKSFKTSQSNVKSSFYLEINLKSLEFFEKAIHHFKKASVILKMSQKSLVIFEKASDVLFKPPFL
jgi:hypothetical protein